MISVIFVIQHRYASHYLQAFIVQMCIDSALQYGVLVELAWCVLRPVRATLPRGTVVGLSLLILAAGGACWPFCGRPNFPPLWHFLTSVQESTAILRILFFLVLVGRLSLAGAGMARSRIAGGHGIGLLFPGEFRGHHGALAPKAGDVVPLGGPRRGSQLRGLIGVLGCQLRPGRSAAPGVHSSNARCSDGHGCGHTHPQPAGSATGAGHPRVKAPGPLRPASPAPAAV